jgi:hypothetical protein
MTAVSVELTSPPIADNEIQMVDDVETLGSFDRCSCSASDDAPYQ